MKMMVVMRIENLMTMILAQKMKLKWQKLLELQRIMIILFPAGL